MTSLSRETVTTTAHRIRIPTRAAISEMEQALAWARTAAEEFDKDTSYDNWAHVVIEDDDIVIEIVTDSFSSPGYDEGSETTPRQTSTYKVTYRVPIKRSADTSTTTTTVQVDRNNDPYFRYHLIQAQHKMPQHNDDEVTTDALSSYLAAQLNIPATRITSIEELTD